MVTRRLSLPFVAGVLAANSLPHLASAAARCRHLTPVAGRESGPGTNLLWGAANLAASLAILARSGRDGERWDSRLVAFDAGAAAFAAWMAGSEALLGVNWARQQPEHK